MSDPATKKELVLGRLPTADAASALQRESLNKLKVRLPTDRFVVRDEREEDYGVDLSIEVLAGSRATNCRSQVQLKGRSGLAPNSDGSFSVSGVRVENLNYLLNGPCPLYILYRPEAEEFLFAFAQDEQQRHAAQPAAEADTVTIRFERKLDEGALDEIATRIVGEAQRARRLRDAVASATPGHPQRLEFDVVRGLPGEVRTQQEAGPLLRDGGVALVSWGFAARVLELLSLLPGRDVRSSSKLSLVKGYAEFSSERYLAADASLRDAAVRRDELDEDDRHFLTFLRNAVDLATGAISPELHRERCDAWRAAAPELLAVQYDVAQLWGQRVGASPDDIDGFQARLEGLLQRIQSMESAPEALRQQTRLFTLTFRSHERAVALMHALVNSQEPELWRHAYDASPQEVIAQQFANLGEWHEELGRLIAGIRSSGNAPLYCQAVHARDIADTFFLSQVRLAALHLGAPPPAVPPELLARLQETQALARRFDLPELELRSRLVESDVADLVGDRVRAVEIASAVRETAATLRYADVVRIADKAIASSLTERIQKDVRRMGAEGVGVFIAEMSDQDLDRYARDTLEMMRLPEDRLSVVRDGIECQRALARLQRDWCRHLELREDGAHLETRRTLWLQAPEQIAVCNLLDRRSGIGTRDWEAVLTTFRRFHCDGCTHRAPGSDPSHGAS